jgi:hypothetical protein
MPLTVTRMNREMLLKNLKLTERHIAESNELIDRQRASIETLERSGQDTRSARKLLVTMQVALSGAVRIRNGIRSLLETSTCSGDGGKRPTSAS